MSRRAPRAALEMEGGGAAAAPGGGGWGVGADDDEAGLPLPLPMPADRRRGARGPPATWEAGPLSASYDWRQFPNRVKLIKRVLALPLLDVQAFCWLDPRAAIAAANDSRRQARAARPKPRLFLASDDSFDSSEDEDGWKEVGRGGGGGGGSGGGGGQRRGRRQPQQQQLARPARAAAAAAAAPLLQPPTSSPSSSSRRWFGTGVVCRDRVLQGLISVDPVTRTLDYSKALPVSLGGGAALVLGASWKIDGSPIVPGQPAWRPALRVGLTTALRGPRSSSSSSRGGPDGDGEGAGDTTRASATIRGSPLGSIHVRQTAFLDRRLGVEVVGDLSARLRPAAAQRASAGAAAAAAAFGGGGFEERGTIPLSPDLFDSVVLHADVSEVNLVWRL